MTPEQLLEELESLADRARAADIPFSMIYAVALECGLGVQSHASTGSGADARRGSAPLLSVLARAQLDLHAMLNDVGVAGMEAVGEMMKVQASAARRADV